MKNQDMQIKKTTIGYLNRLDPNTLTASYMLLTFKYPPTGSTKKDLVMFLIESVPIDIVTQHHEYIESVKNEDFTSFQQYQLEYYNAMNNYLRSVPYDSAKFNPDKVRFFTRHLFNMILKAPKIQNPVDVFRGENDFITKFAFNDEADEKTNGRKIDQMNLKPGDVFAAKGFNSFSAAPWIALKFSAMQPCCVYRLRIDQNVPALVYDIRKYLEFEVLLPPCRFMVVDKLKLKSPLSDLVTITVYVLSFVDVDDSRM